MKRGQVTAFVILGLVLLAGVITIYTFRAQLFTSLFSQQIEQSAVVPAQAEKVRLYVDTCVNTITQQGIDILGAQGGYITLPAAEGFAGGPFGNALDVFGKNNGQVPYWFTEAGNGLQKTLVPTKQMMERELAGYIDGNLAFCLNDFKPLREQGYLISGSLSQTQAVINEKNVVVNMKYPLNIVKDDFSFTFNTFQKTMPSQIGSLYASAVEVMQAENKDTFLEERALDMMALYDTIPFSGVDISCVPRTWIKTNVQNELKKIFAGNFPAVRMKNTPYLASDALPKSFIIPGMSRSLASVLFTYQENWPLLMDVVGENEEVLRGKPFTAENAASRFLQPLFCLNDNHFVYNVQFPMLISLQEGGSVFQFATLVVINHNQPRENRVTPVLSSLLDDICQNPGKSLTVVAAAYLPDNTLQELPDARISYQCLNQVCSIGQTRSDAVGAAVKGEFPQCSDGTLIAEKEGYSRSELPLSTNTEEGEVTIYLERITEIPVAVKIMDNAQQREPYASEQVYVTLENVEKKYTTTFLYPDQKTVKLIPGNYVITSRVIISNAGSFSFPEKEIEICSDIPQKGVLGIVGLNTRQCVKQKIEATKLDQMIGGGATTSWTVPRAALANAQSLTLFTTRGPTPRSLDEVSKVYEAIQRQNSEVSKPILQ